MGKRSCFYFIIPTLSLSTAAMELEKPPGQLMSNEKATNLLGEKSCILLVEDNETNLMVTGDYLHDKGYQVVTATDGFKAIESAQTHKPDLILMDIQMPEFNGLEAIRRLRELCLEAGANEYLAKPVSLKKMIELIEDLLKEQ